MKISSIDMVKGMMARTLVEVDEHHKYEVMTCDTTKMVDQDVSDFWESLLRDYPYETVIYALCPTSKPPTANEVQLAELLPVNSELRRNLDLGDLYVSRSANEEAAAMEHDNVIAEFKAGTIILMTQEERAAVYGPGKLWQ